MLKAIVTILLFVSAGIAQSSSDGSFSVRHITNPGVSLTPAQMHEAEKLYRNACAVVKRDFRSNAELRPRFTVVLGAERDEVRGKGEIWLRKWSPAMFAEGVVVVAFDQVLTSDMVKQLAIRAVQYSNATVDVAEIQSPH